MKYDKPNAGVLFPNDNPGDNRPDFKGKLNVNGVEMDLAAWKRVSKTNQTPYLSVKLSEKWTKQDTSQERSPAVADDVIPF